MIGLSYLGIAVLCSCCCVAFGAECTRQSLSCVGIFRGWTPSMAPELFDTKAMPTIESEIFGYGNLLWELMEQKRRLLDSDTMEIWEITR
jgi:hypothetical protein